MWGARLVIRMWPAPQDRGRVSHEVSVSVSVRVGIDTRFSVIALGLEAHETRSTEPNLTPSAWRRLYVT